MEWVRTWCHLIAYRLYQFVRIAEESGANELIDYGRNLKAALIQLTIQRFVSNGATDAKLVD